MSAFIFRFSRSSSPCRVIPFITRHSWKPTSSFMKASIGSTKTMVGIEAIGMTDRGTMWTPISCRYLYCAYRYAITARRRRFSAVGITASHRAGGHYWGPRWETRHRDWDRWDRNRAPRPAPLPSYQREYSGERYPDRQQQHEIRERNYPYQPDRSGYEHRSRDVDLNRGPDQDHERNGSWEGNRRGNSDRQQPGYEYRPDANPATNVQRERPPQSPRYSIPQSRERVEPSRGGWVRPTDSMHGQEGRSHRDSGQGQGGGPDQDGHDRGPDHSSDHSPNGWHNR